MAWHLYIVPAIGDGSRNDPRRPKYVAELSVSWAGMSYGFQPVFMVAADTDASQDASISGQSDTNKVPDNLDSNPSAGGVTAVQNFLEAIHVPAGWVTTSLTWRQITRTVAGLFQFMQRLKSFLGNQALINGSTITLNTQFNQLSANTRQALIDTATSFSYNTSDLSGTSTIRQILKAMSDQWGSKPLVIGGIIL